ncbi:MULTISPECIES: FdhF/YdeP family oxidoreductase [Corynebacterium]|uniref:FdhF/YdeP family oxidoreductase n=1 Tax=Corynebacterium TaxID=1716 RepID=UPI00178C2735|nr:MULTISPECIES: FdhF/YdeP family oxidoreductase [Corynebacterium]
MTIAHIDSGFRPPAGGFKPAPVNPVANEFDNPESTGKPKPYAAGIPGVAHAMQHAVPNRGLLPLLTMNKPGGVDCPGCAWPEPPQHELGIVEFCENGAKAIAEETTPDRADRDFWASVSVPEMREKTDYWLGKRGRITEPLLYDRSSGDEHYRPISWEDAFSLIADKLSTIHPDEAVFYTSGRASNESAYMIQLLARRFGTNNLPDCANMCHDSTGAALGETLGLGKGSVVIEDFSRTDLIISVGQNPGTNHPRALGSFSKCKENGGKILAINPMPETGLRGFRDPQEPTALVGKPAKLADEFLQVRLDGDRAFFQALNKELIRRDALDHKFLDNFCSGVEETIEHLNSLDDAELLRGCGLSMADIKKAADMVEEARTVVLTWTLGVTQHENAVYTIREMVNFLLLTGNIGKPGAGTAPLRGHSNVQGDRTMGVWEKIKEPFRLALEERFGFDCPAEDGLGTVPSLQAMRSGKTKFFLSLGGNLVRVASDTSVVEQAMASNELTVHLSTKPNGSHAWPGEKSLILPVLARTDVDNKPSGPQKVTVEDSAGAVHASEGHRTANHDLSLRSEIEILGTIGKMVCGDEWWQPMIDDYSVIRDHIAATIPGFEDYNKRIENPGGFMLPNGPRQREFNTHDGKAHLTVNETNVIDLREGELLMNTVRSHDQYNSTIYGLDDRYRGIKNGRRVVFMNPEDARERGVRDGDLVDLVSRYSDSERRAPNFRIVEFPVAKDCVTTYFPEANVLVPLDSRAHISHTPVSKSCRVFIEPLGRNVND